MASRASGQDDFTEGEFLGRIRMTLENPGEVLDGIGLMMVAESQKAFRQQRLGGVKWKTRGETGMNPNWPGILADFARGRSAPPTRRFRDKPALQDSGMLKKSVRHRLASSDTVEVGSNLEYAGPLHAGEDTETVRITETIQDRLWKWLKRRAEGQRHRKALGWLLNKKFRGETLTISHPPRPIVGLPKQLTRDIETVFGVTVRRA